jgi:hypothetical protein
MRRLLVAGLFGLFLLTAAALTGCGNRQATFPEKSIDVPKQGPVPAGAPGAGVGNQKKGEAAN